MSANIEQFKNDIEELNILKLDYSLDILIRMAHHSSAIEGNTFTMSESYNLLIDDTTPETSKPLRELYEVYNHQESFIDIYKQIKNGNKVDLNFIKIIQKSLMKNILSNPGEFKNQENMILGATFLPAKPKDVPELLRQWSDDTNYQLKNLNQEDFINALAEQHIKFEKVHPFPDGNGRTGRMLINYASIKKLGLPIIIEKEERPIYMEMMRNQDSKALAKLFTDKLNDESVRKEEFYRPFSNS